MQREGGECERERERERERDLFLLKLRLIGEWVLLLLLLWFSRVCLSVLHLHFK